MFTRRALGSDDRKEYPDRLLIDSGKFNTDRAEHYGGTLRTQTWNGRVRDSDSLTNPSTQKLLTFSKQTKYGLLIAFARVRKQFRKPFQYVQTLRHLIACWVNGDAIYREDLRQLHGCALKCGERPVRATSLSNLGRPSSYHA